VDTLAELVEADRLEEAGAPWEEVAWRRLLTTATPEGWPRLTVGTVFVLPWPGALEVCTAEPVPGAGWWLWVRGMRQWQRAHPRGAYAQTGAAPPPWVRTACEGAAALAVARALAALEPGA
jgi:hypothetical protein